MLMTKTEYAEYLKSPRWQELRKEVLHNTPHCSECHLPRWLAAIAYDQDLHVHHHSYKNLGKQDEYRDLTPLCRRCHEIETFGRSDLRAPKHAVCVVCKSRHWNPYEDLCPNCIAYTVSEVDAYFSLNCVHPDFGDEPLWAITMRWGIKALGASSNQLNAVELAIDILAHLESQIQYRIAHPEGTDRDIAPIDEVLF